MKNRKKIGIISYSLNGNKTGVGQYLNNLLECIFKIDDENEYILINYKDNSFKFNVKTKKIVDYLYKYFLHKSIHLWYLMVPRKTRKNNFDLIFSPAHIPTFFRFSSAYILTVCDIIPILFPNTGWLGKSVYYKLTLPRSLKCADEIIVISQSTKNDLIEHLNIPKEKIRVIYLAANENYKQLPKEDVFRIKAKYNLDFQFILHVGDLDSRKNVLGLINAFRSVKRKMISHKLVLTGRKVPKNVIKEIEKLNLNKDVIFTGYVPDEDLPALYNAADLFVYPSIYEGFGLPPLEAMACGTPVITSNVSSLPEVVGDAGIMVDPYNITNITAAMEQILTDDELKNSLIKNNNGFKFMGFLSG